MANILSCVKNHIRFWVQLLFSAVTNGYAAGFLQGKIYRGTGKNFCLPGLNCYSCPGALGSCPIGAFQAVAGSRNFKFAFYVTGFLLFAGALLGRFVCGWLCPFGLLQDILYKIPFIQKRKRLPGDSWLKYLRYAFLALFVIVLPITALDIGGQGQPWFCKYICPSGMVMGALPLLAANEQLRGALGWLFTWKMVLLLLLLLLALWVYRPFCRYLCPLGAVYGFFNKAAVFRYQVDESLCVRCGQCQEACDFGIDVYRNPNSSECIRCGKCKKACPVSAIRMSAADKKEKKNAVPFL
ncbi:MAG: 4Fe-4S binding protein [Ruminococcus sp.]